MEGEVNHKPHSVEDSFRELFAVEDHELTIMDIADSFPSDSREAIETFANENQYLKDFIELILLVFDESILFRGLETVPGLTGEDGVQLNKEKFLKSFTYSLIAYSAFVLKEPMAIQMIEDPSPIHLNVFLGENNFFDLVSGEHCSSDSYQYLEDKSILQLAIVLIQHSFSPQTHGYMEREENRNIAITLLYMGGFAEHLYHIEYTVERSDFEEGEIFFSEIIFPGVRKETNIPF